MARISREERVARARERAKRTILGLVSASNGRLVGKLRLYKAFYRAHLLYFEKTGLELTGYSIVHMDNGPGIDNAGDLIDELMDEGTLQEIIGNGDRKKEHVYVTIGCIRVEDDEDKAEAMLKAVQWANSLDEEELKVASHNRSWHESVSGKEQNIFVDVLTDDRVNQIRTEADDRLARIKNLVAAL
jgi:hypothetical protein